MRSANLVFGLVAALAATSCATPQSEMAAAPNPRVKFGKPISNADIAAWDIDIRTSDGKGLPVRRGTVVEGKAVYDAKCIACHGAQAQRRPAYLTMVAALQSVEMSIRLLTRRS